MFLLNFQTKHEVSTPISLKINNKTSNNIISHVNSSNLYTQAQP